MRSRSVRPTAARFGAASLVVVGLALLGACTSGSGNSSGSGGTSPATSHTATPQSSMSVSAATCQHVASLRKSLENLTHLQLNASASTQIRTDLTNIQTQLHAIKATSNGALSGQVSALSSSLNQVDKAAKNLSSPPTSSQVEAIISALGGLKSSSKNTLAALDSACPNS